MSGFVSLVGAGPGDPGLLTLAGRDRLADADVVVYDRLINPALLEHAPNAEQIFAGKSPAGHTLSQTQLNALLVEKARAGKRVVRLKGGDPFVFGRGGEEALALAAAGVPFEVIPGVTSAVAAPAYAGVPVSHRGLASSFAVITGHEQAGKEEADVDWTKLATAVDTLVILMGAAALTRVARALIEGGRPPSTPTVSIEWGTLQKQRSVTAPLEAIAATVQSAGLKAPLLTVVGEVASLRDQIGWFEGRPLLGKRVLVTRTRAQASALSDRLAREGAQPVELPTIETVSVATDTEVKDLGRRLAGAAYDYCLFLSTTAVDYLLDRVDGAALAGVRVGAIGNATAATLARRGVPPSLTAANFTSEGMLAALADTEMQGCRVLLPRGEGGTPTLGDGLRARGALVDEVVLYASRPPQAPDEAALALIRAGKIDVATFASSSSLRNLAGLLGDDFARLRGATIACIGPVTSSTARELGLRVKVEPAEHTIAALVAALKAHFA